MKKSLAIILAGIGILLALPRLSGAQWLQVHKFNLTQIKCLISSGPDLFLGTKAPLAYFGNGTIMRSTDNGVGWSVLGSQGWPARSKTPYNEGITIECLAVSGSNIIAGTYNSSVFVSRDNGQSWTAANSGLPKNALVQCLAVSGTDVFAGFWNESVFLSKDGGATWTAANAGLPVDRQTTCLAVSRSHVFVGTYGRGIFVSADNGTSWAEAGPGLPKNPQYPEIRSLAVSGSAVFAGFAGGVYRSMDNGKSWTAVNSGLPNNAYVVSLAVSGSNLFAATFNTGVFISTDNGSSWKRTGPGMPAGTSIWGLAVNDTHLIAHTLGEIWRLSLADITPRAGQGPASSPGTADAGEFQTLMTNGGRAYQAGDFANAVIFYGKAIEKDPKSVNAWSQRAWSYVKIGGKSNCDKAIADVARVLELDPANKAIHFARGEAYRIKGYFALDVKNEKQAAEYLDGALADYRVALEANPGSPVIAINVGRVYFVKGDLDRALAIYADLFEKKPDDGEVKEQLQLLFAAYGRRNSAPDCGSAKQTNLLAGRYYLEKKVSVLAIPYLTRAIELGMTDVFAYHDRARAYEMNGELDKAMADADAMIKVYPSDFSYEARADIRSKKGDLDGAIADLSKAIKFQWKDIKGSPWDYNLNNLLRLYMNRVDVYVAKKDWGNALADLKYIDGHTKPNPSKARMLLKMAAVYKMKGDTKNAQKRAEQAMAMDPSLKK